MFGIIRLIVVCVFLCCSVAVTKKSRAIRKRMLYIVFLILSVILIYVSMFFPFENFFISFDSPQAAFDYYNFGKSNIVLVVEGNDCDFIVDSKDNSTYSHLIIPKNEEGWKIGTGINTKIIAQKHYDGITVVVYQYKNTNDYFITIIDTSGNETIISDDYNTKFYSLEQNVNYLEKSFVSYYAHITDFNLQYSVTVNGNKIIFDGYI